MSKLQGRGPIALAGFAVALAWSVRADAQVGPSPGNGGLVNNLVIGAQFEVTDRAKAERRLGHLEAKIRRDAERGDADAVGRDARRITDTRFRLGVDEWLIRKNLCQELGPYPNLPRIDAMSCAAMASVRRPQYTPSPPILPDNRLR